MAATTQPTKAIAGQTTTSKTIPLGMPTIGDHRQEGNEGYRDLGRCRPDLDAGLHVEA